MELKYFDRYVILGSEDVEFHSNLMAVIKNLDPVVMILSVFDRVTVADYLNRLPKGEFFPLAIIIDSTVTYSTELFLSPLHFCRTYKELKTIFVAKNLADDQKERDDFFQLPGRNSPASLGLLKDAISKLLRLPAVLKVENESAPFRRKP